MDAQDAQDNQYGRLLHDLQPIDYKALIIIDLISIGRLEFPHYIPLFKKEFTGPPKMLLDVTVRPSRGVHLQSEGGARSRTAGWHVIAGISNRVRIQVITA